MISSCSFENTPTRRTDRGSPPSTDAARSIVTWRGPPAKMTPTYDAPNAAASRASSARVIPQNLISGDTRSSRHTREASYGCGGIRGRGHARADENRIGTDARHALDVG